MSGPDSSYVCSIQHESEGWKFESPSGQYIFRLKTFDIFKRTPVRVSKMKAFASAQIIFQMLTLLQKYLYRQNQYSNTWDSKYLAMIAQMFRAFGMNPNFGGSSPPQVEILSVPKTLTLSQEPPFMCWKWMLLPAKNILNVNFTPKYENNISIWFCRPLYLVCKSRMYKQSTDTCVWVIWMKVVYALEHCSIVVYCALLFS